MDGKIQLNYLCHDSNVLEVKSACQEILHAACFLEKIAKYL